MNNQEEINVVIHKIQQKEEELSKLRKELNLLILKEIELIREKALRGINQC